MSKILRCWLLLSLLTLSAMPMAQAAAPEMPVEDAWKALPQYQYGQKNSASGASNCDQGHQYQYGQGNSNSGTGICDGTNCKKTS